jgi:hypothetical protein
MNDLKQRIPRGIEGIAEINAAPVLLRRNKFDLGAS